MPAKADHDEQVEFLDDQLLPRLEEAKKGKRTVLFVAMLVISLLAAVAAWRIRAALLARVAPWTAGLLAIGGYVAVLTLAGLILPSVQETAAGLPADVLLDFRLASLGTSLMLWATVGLGFGAAAERLLTTPRAPAPAR